jgi:peptide/nickel transport system substrate-binding protein
MTPLLAGCAPKVEPPVPEKHDIERRLRFGLPAQISTLDPAVAVDIESRRVLRQCLQTLIGTDSATGASIPRLASRYRLLHGGLSVEFTLQKGLHFHDGTPFDAVAVRDTFERLYHLPKTLYEAYPTNDFRSLFRAHADESTESLYRGCDIVAEGVVVLNLGQPLTGIIPALSQIGFGILSPTQTAERRSKGAGVAVSPEAFLPVGTGPFSLARATTTSATLTRFDKNAESPIAVTGIDFTVHPDETDRLSALLDGRLDAFDLVTPRMAAPLARSAMKTQTRDPFSLLYLGMNQAHPVLKNPEIRSIIERVISKQPLIQGQFLNGTKTSDTFFPPRLGIPVKADPNAPGPLNASEAAAALQKAGYKGQTVEFVYPLGAPRIYVPYPEKTYAILARQLQAAGINIKPVPIEWSEGYYKQLLSRSSRGLHLLGMNGGYQDPGYFVNALFMHSRAEFGFENKELTSMLQAAAKMSDDDARRAAYAAISTKITEIMPAVPLVVPVSALASTAYILDLPASPVLDEVFSTVRFS